MRPRTTCGGTARCIGVCSTHWPAFTAACWMRAAAPADCSRACGRSGRTCGRSAWNGPQPASRRAAAKSGAPVVARQRQRTAVRRCAASMPRSPPTCCATARSIRRWRWPNCAACCARAAGWSSTCRPTPGCCRRTTGRCTTSAAAPRASSRPCCATPASSACAPRYWNGLLLPLMVVQRKLLARHAAASDVAPFPPWLDAMFHAMTEIERRLPFRLPAGGSVLATAERP